MPAAYYYYYILQYSPLIPLLYGLPRYKMLGKPLRIFLGYLAVSLLLTIIMTLLALKGINNLWLMNLSLPAYAGLFLWMFSLWEEDRKQRIAFVLLSISFLLIWAYEIIVTGRLFEFTTYARPFVGLIFVYLSCRSIYEANKDMTSFITSQPRFWISSGLIVYYGGMIIINLVSEKLLHHSTSTLLAILYLQPSLVLGSHLLYWGGLKFAARAPLEITEVKLSA